MFIREGESYQIKRRGGGGSILEIQRSDQKE